MDVINYLKPKSSNEINSVIDNYLLEFEETHLPNGFKWRKGQKETVQEIVLTYLRKKNNYVILDCPTGGGKSLIAMAVSFILNNHSKTGYILTSEISLQDQYEQDINKFKLPWGSVKGIDNYLCSDNGEKHSLGSCKIRNKKPQSMKCYKTCPYFSARDFAMQSQTSILNYSYWLIMQNFVNPKLKNENGESSPFFPTRDFIICDEAHKILDIVQNHYSPRFDKSINDKLEYLCEFFNNHKIKDHSSDILNIKENITKLWGSENQDSLHSYLNEIEVYLKSIKVSSEVLREKVETEYKNKKAPKEWMKALYLSDWLKDFHCKIEDYNYIISETSTRNLIKNPSGEEIIFNCLEENYLMNNYFHKHGKFAILMSATFADPVEYMKNINIKGAKYIKSENSFNYDKSPIHYYPKRRMSYKEFDKNKEWLYDKINEIMDNHKGENGLIHSASYDLSSKIRDNLSFENKKRLFIYSGTDEKRASLDMLKMSKGKVIIGPSLLEGIDLRDDYCRFIIFPKVPYANLNDRFIKTKLNINPSWYRWRTILSLLQGAGRGIRNETDWAKTYILDGCFSDLLHNNRKSFPIEFIQRIKVFNE